MSARGPRIQCNVSEQYGIITSMLCRNKLHVQDKSLCHSYMMTSMLGHSKVIWQDKSFRQKALSNADKFHKDCVKNMAAHSRSSKATLVCTTDPSTTEQPMR